MFEGRPSYNPYRALHLTDPQQEGEDVYALQLALNGCFDFEVPLTADGVLGQKTSKTIIAAQVRLTLAADGVAGQKTQTALSLRLGKLAQRTHPLPPGLPAGQLSHESSFLLGNYSTSYPDGSFDAGVAQRNTNFTAPRHGFDPVESISVLCQHCESFHDEFAGVPTERRRWELAVGAWNAPAFARYIAKEEGATEVRSANTARPSDDARMKLEAYMDSCCAFLQI